MQKYEITDIAYLISITYFLSISTIKRDATCVLVRFRFVRVRPIISLSAEFSASRLPRFFIILHNFHCETKLIIKAFAWYSRILNCIHREVGHYSGTKLLSSIPTIIFQISSFRNSKRFVSAMFVDELVTKFNEKNMRNVVSSRKFLVIFVVNQREGCRGKRGYVKVR